MRGRGWGAAQASSRSDLDELGAAICRRVAAGESLRLMQGGRVDSDGEDGVELGAVAAAVRGMVGLGASVETLEGAALRVVVVPCCQLTRVLAPTPRGEREEGAEADRAAGGVGRGESTRQASTVWRGVTPSTLTSFSIVQARSGCHDFRWVKVTPGGAVSFGAVQLARGRAAAMSEPRTAGTLARILGRPTPACARSPRCRRR